MPPPPEGLLLFVLVVIVDGDLLYIVAGEGIALCSRMPNGRSPPSVAAVVANAAGARGGAGPSRGGRGGASLGDKAWNRRRRNAHRSPKS